MSEAARPKATGEPMIERRSIDYVPSSERRGTLWHQGPFWFTSNFVVLTMIVGFTGPSLGLGVAWSVLAVTLGVAIGTFFMAFHANQGPRMGLPQMIQSRAQFGGQGAVLPFAATVFVYVGFLVFDVILAAQGLRLVLPMNAYVLYPVLVAVSIVIAVVGHDLLHFVQRWLTVLLIIVFAVLTALALDLPPAPETGDTGWSGSAFLVQLSLAAGYNISYAVYVSDYTRYLPARASAPKLIFWTYLGASGSAIWLMALGAVLGSRLPGLDGVSALRRAGDMLFPGFGTFSVVIAVVALVTVMGVNAYGAMLTGTSAVDGFRPVRPTVRLRVIGLGAVGLVSVLIALLIPDDYLDSFNSFVVLMLYFLIPWTAVNLVDFYFVRHGEYAITEIFHPRGIYGRWSWRGMTAYLVGLVAMVPFFATPFYVGPVASALDGADISFLVGLPIAGGLYYLFSRTIDRAAETEAVARSRRELEGDAEVARS
jgi:nucleobase:cation symporter-1, NCS1 family